MDTTMVAMDRDYRILGTSGSFEDVLSQWIGRRMWDAFPDAEPVFKPIYEEAWQTGWCYRTVEFRGDLVQVHANRCEPTLHVQVTTLTVSGMDEFVARAQSASARSFPHVSRERHLRAV